MNRGVKDVFSTAFQLYAVGATTHWDILRIRSIFVEIRLQKHVVGLITMKLIVAKDANKVLSTVSRFVVSTEIQLAPIVESNKQACEYLSEPMKISKALQANFS